MTGRPAADNVTAREVMLATLRLQGWEPITWGQGGIVHEGHEVTLWVDGRGDIGTMHGVPVRGPTETWPRHSVLARLVRYFEDHIKKDCE